LTGEILTFKAESVKSVKFSPVKILRYTVAATADASNGIFEATSVFTGSIKSHVGQLISWSTTDYG